MWRREQKPIAATLDALGTIVRLDPPATQLIAELEDRGVAVSTGEAERAFAAEICFYRAHHLEGSDPARLKALRRSCVAVLGANLPISVRARLSEADLEDAMLASLHFSEIPGAREALRRLGDMGLRLAIVSNWDVSLEEVLEMLDLRVLVDHVVTSAEVGHAKPDPRIFRYALQLLEVEACAAVHVGDSWELDVVGARNAHIRPVLVGERGRSVTTLHAIAELPNLLGEAK